jgi:hypothetical protein
MARPSDRGRGGRSGVLLLMRALARIAVAVLALVCGLSAAEAHGHRHHVHGIAGGLGVGLAHMIGVDRRPHAWCGWFMRHEVGSDPGPDYNLARNWRHWGRPAWGPAPGVIGVMWHHVFKVVVVLGHNTVLAISGNDSHMVRTRPRSTTGVIAWRTG